MIVCGECGNHNTDGDTFCGSCGAFLEWTGEKASVPEPEPEPEPEAEPEPERRPGLVERVKTAVGLPADETPSADQAAPSSPAPPIEPPAAPPPPTPETVAAAPGLPASPSPTPATPSLTTRPAPTPTVPTPPTSTLPASTPPAPTAPRPAPPAAQKPAVPQPPPQQPAARKPAAEKARPAPKVATAAPRTPSPGDLICGQCGEGNDPGRSFCRRCGNSLAEAAVSAPVPWWRRLFRRRPKVVAAGQRPVGRGGRSGRGSSGLSKVIKLLVLVAVVGGAGLALAGPWRSKVGDLRKDVIGSFNPVRPTKAEATSQLAGHPAAAAVDGITTTYWAEGAKGNGEGQALVLRFGPPADIDKVGFTSGASQNPEDFLAQPRPKDLHLVFSDGSTRDVTLKDSSKFQTVGVKARAVTSLEIRIVSVYPSLSGDACSIAEVELFVKK